MKKSKLFSLIAAIVVVSVGFISCGDDFKEINQNPTPVPIEKKMVLNLNVDFPSFESVDGFYAATVASREGLNYTLSDGFLSIETNDQGWGENLSITLPSYFDSLRGETCEIKFMVTYRYEGVFQTAELIRSVTFSASDTTNLGNVGFSNYEWRTHPPLRLVVVPDLKLYASSK